MGERSLRGSRLGALSYETDAGVELAPRQTVSFDCPNGHLVEVVLAAEATPPAAWECRSCGAIARRRSADAEDAQAARPQRTPWDMLLERRTVDDLETLLDERLTELRDLGGARRVQPRDHRKDLQPGEGRTRRKSA
jgi:hypothetical protein